MYGSAKVLTITIAYHSQYNAIHCAPYANRSNKHQLAAYNSIMHCLTNRGHNVDLQSSTTKSAQKSRPPLRKRGKYVTSLSLQTSIVAMPPSALFKSSSPTSLPSSPVYLLPSLIPLPLGPAPSPNRFNAQTPLPILCHVKHVSLGTLQWPLQLQCHPSSATWLPRHHPQQASHPPHLGLPRL